MERAAEGHTLTIGEQRVAMAIADPKAEARLRDRVAKRGGAISVRMAAVDASDVEGHVFQVAQRSIALRLQLDEDDTEGHAISLHFPSVEEADKFRRNLLAAGLLAGTLVVGSAGAIAITSQPAASDVAAPVQATQAYERPAGRGLLEGADIAAPQAAAPQAAAVTATGIDPVTGQPTRTGMQQGADLGTAANAGLSGGQALERPAGSGPLEGADR